MKKISFLQVKHVADLAKLSLNNDELEMFQKQLEEILDYVDKLKEVETKGIKPTNQVTGALNVVREDKTKDSFSQNEVISGAKHADKGMFKVKAIFEEK